MSKIQVHDYSIPIPDAQKRLEGRRFVFLSDLHSKQYGKGNKDLLSLIAEWEPDYVLIGGDMFIGYREEWKEKRRKAWVAEQLVMELAFHYPVYYTDGNHEGKCPEEWMDGYRWRLKRAGVHFVNNASACLEPQLYLHGLVLEQDWYPKGRRVRYPLTDMQDKLGKLPLSGWEKNFRISDAGLSQQVFKGAAGEKEDFHILMAHHPAYFATYARWGADLVLSGHMHGGVLRLPGMGGVIGPDFLPFPAYSGGAYRKGTSTMLVSCGLGAHTIPIRIFNPPELLGIVLTSSRTCQSPTSDAFAL